MRITREQVLAMHEAIGELVGIAIEAGYDIGDIETNLNAAFSGDYYRVNGYADYIDELMGDDDYDDLH